MQNIFYGAGRYAAENLTQLLVQGIVPVCFVDADERKQFALFPDSNGYPVLPLKIAINKYPDYRLWLTVGNENLFTIRQYLLGEGIREDRLCYTEAIEYRNGCLFLGKAIKHYGDYFMACHFPCGEKLASTGNFKEDYHRYKDYCSSLIHRLKSNEPTPCDACYNLREGYYPVGPVEPKMIVFATGFAGDICNFRCVHCFVEKNFENVPHYNGQDFIETLRTLDEVVLHENFTVYIANGEPTARKDFKKMIEAIRGKNWKILIATNGSMYRYELAELIKEGHNIILNISPDCGSSETFKKIKGIDCFKKFISNIEKYANVGAKFQLKYTLIQGVNDNVVDADGFIELAVKYGVAVIVSNNILEIMHPLPQDSLNILLRIINKAKEKGLCVYYASENFHVEDAAAIEIALKN